MSKRKTETPTKPELSSALANIGRAGLCTVAATEAATQTIADQRREMATWATVATHPISVAAIATKAWSEVSSNLELGELADSLKSSMDRLSTHGLEQAEQMLLCQSITLQSLFGKLLADASRTEHIGQRAQLLTLAMKAQSQCRTTLEALGEMRNPKSISFVRQANIAAGHQQVNNSVSPPDSVRPREQTKSDSEQSKLLPENKATNDAVDAGSQGATGGGDSTLEAVGKIDRTADNRRKAAGVAKLVQGRKPRRTATGAGASAKSGGRAQ